MKKLFVSLALVLVVVVPVFAASCGPAEEAARTYKLGFLGPLTGPAAAWILPMHRGIEMAIDEINEAGGIVVGGETYMLELAVADDKYSPEESVTGVQKLIYNDKVDYIFGPIGSTTGSAVRPISEENDVVIFVGTPAGDDFPIGPEYPYTFAYGDPLDIRVESNYQWLEENRPEVQTVAHIGPHSPGGETVRDLVIEAAEARGLEVVAAELAESDTVDFSPHLTTMLARNPDLIDCSGTATGSIGLVVKQASQMGYEGLFMSAPYPNAAALNATAGEYAEGFIGTGTPLAEKGNAEQRAFYDWYVDLHGAAAWGAGALWGYDWVYWMVQVFQEADSFDPDVVVPILEVSEIEALAGTMWFTGVEEWGIAHQRIVSPVAVLVFQNGEWEPLASIDVPKD